MCMATEERSLICTVGRDSALYAIQLSIAKEMHHQEMVV